jgi:hypothetical protein
VNEHNQMILKLKETYSILIVKHDDLHLFDRAMGNVMSCEWRIWNDVVALHDISGCKWRRIVFDQVGGQRTLVRFHAGSSLKDIKVIWCKLTIRICQFLYRYVIIS